jgi:DNA polymerase delta subunit 1
MVNCGNITIFDCAKYGALAAAMCTAKFEKPNVLVFETIKLRGLWINKKRYAALEIERVIPGERMVDAIARGKVSVKGLEGKRRDNAPIGRETQNAIIKILLKEGDPERAAAYVRGAIADLLMGRVDLSKLVITKGLAKTKEQYAKGGTHQPQVEVQEKIRKRAHETGEEVPETGDRIPYIRLSSVAKKTGKGSSKAYELVEDPLYAQRTGAPIDTDYYVHKQIWPACSRVLTCVYEPERCRDIKSAMSDKDRESLAVYKRLFSASLPHMRQTKRARVKSYGIAAFARPLPQCVSCKVIIPAGNLNPLCKACDADADRLHHAMEAELVSKKRARDDAWDTCNACAGTNVSLVKNCANVGCENFFHRNAVVTDVEDLVCVVDKFAAVRGPRNARKSALALMGIGKRRACAREPMRVVARMVVERTATRKEWGKV